MPKKQIKRKNKKRGWDGGIRSGASPLSRQVPKNDSPNRFSGYAVGTVRIPPSCVRKKGCLMGILFLCRRRRDSNPRDPEVKRISSAPRYDRFDTSAYTVPVPFGVRHFSFMIVTTFLFYQTCCLSCNSQFFVCGNYHYGNFVAVVRNDSFVAVNIVLVIVNACSEVA